MMISFRGKDKNQLQSSEQSMGDARVLSQSSLLRNPLPKPSVIKDKTQLVEESKTNLMSLAILFHFLCAQHVSDINISINRRSNKHKIKLNCWFVIFRGVSSLLTKDVSVYF